MSEDEFDNITDDIADIQDVDWARILAGSGSVSNEEQHLDLPGSGEDIPFIPARPGSSHSSTDYFEDDYHNLDLSLLAELDRIEEDLVAVPQLPIVGVAPQQSELTSDLRPSHHFSALNVHPQKKRKEISDSQSDEESPNALSKKQRLDDTPCFISSQGKGKMKANDNTLQRILSTYEYEITCPICCDFYAFAHISNPCGHSFCGSCGREWHKKNKTCPVCRTRLESASPMIPNITVDNVVEKHIQALASSGEQDWEPGGLKAEEWHKRKQAWRNSATERAKLKSATAHQTRIFIPSVVDLTGAIHTFQPPDWYHTEDNWETDPTYEDSSDIELIPRPIRQARQVQRPARAGPPAHVSRQG